MKNLKKKSIQGYTLAEMLVVAAIIAVVLGISATTMKNLAQSKGVAAGIPIVKAVFEEARQKALGTGNRVRVVVYVDTAGAGQSADDTERFCRYIGVAQYYSGSSLVENPGPSDSGEWRISGKGVYLPKKCYFDVVRSRDGLASYVISVAADSAALNGICNVMLPGESTPKQCFFFEYNGIGLVSNPRIQSKTANSAGGAARAVLTSGRLGRNGAGGIAVIDPARERDQRGFILTRHGEMIDYTELGDLN